MCYKKEVLSQMNKRVAYFDILNILACISVVYLHCNGIVHQFSNTNAWKGALVVEVLCYFAVPVFLMLSGANLLNYRKKYDTKTFFKKRLIKVLVPYLIWSLIYYIAYYNCFIPKDFIVKFLNCNIESVFWFFPTIIWLYLIMPLFSSIAERDELKTLKYFVLIIFISVSCVPYIFSILGKDCPSIFRCLDGIIGYYIYIILGYLLSKKDIKKAKRICIYILAIICLLFRYIYTYHFSIQNNFINRNSWGYLSVICVIPSVAVFLFVKNINWNKFINEKSANILAKISNCSFGIYLMHILVKLKVTNFLNLDISSLFYRIIFPIILYLLCLFCTYVIKKIPVIKKIVP